MKTRLINELLPEARSILLPRELSGRKVPSELCNLLNRDPGSPFHNLIERISVKGSGTSVIADTAIIAMIRNSMGDTSGPLPPTSRMAGIA